MKDNYDHYADEFVNDDDEFETYDCGWMPGGGCSKAGTEECDWMCPFNKPVAK